MDYKDHRSIRKYSSREVSDALLREIIEIGARGSNTGNMQTYSVVVVRDPKQKRALAPLHFNQPMVESASAVLVFCADFHRFSAWCRARNAEAGYGNLMGVLAATIDTVIFAQTVAVAAEEKGLGLCYLGTTLYSMEQHCKLLELPLGVFPVTTLTLGYPDEMPPLTERLPLEAILHEEVYRTPSPAQIDEFYGPIEELEKNKAFVQENGKETLAQVFTDVRYKPEDYRALSTTILEALRRQQFDV